MGQLLRRYWLIGLAALPTGLHGSGPAMEATASDGARDTEAHYTLECYYRAQWGSADEFIRLFRKNHLPVLNALREKGRILDVKAVKPRYHGGEETRWDYRVTIVFKNAEIAADSSVEEELKKQLFPDQETFAREESRRFAILNAHWDVPVVDVALEE